VFTETPYAHEGGYDLTIGTSERGENVDDVVDGIGGEFKSVVTASASSIHPKPDQSFTPGGRMIDGRHMLLVLGGLSGLELSIATDETLEPRLTAADAPLLFDYWLNTLPFQGSRTVRTEEALLVSLGALRRLLFRS
jgi:predicted SPOUT superfamily RNA methylase MTH1